MQAWAFFGKSYTYGVFLGLAELFAGLFILFDRTRLAGLLLALGVYLNVVIVDIEFGIIEPLIHAIPALIIILLLLTGYVKDLKTFFWDRGGRINDTPGMSNKWAIITPAAFAVIVLAGVTFGLSKASSASTTDILGTYTLSQFIIDNDTIPLSRGKYTDAPTIFFETSNSCIISADGGTYYGQYTLTGDSIHIKLMEALHGIDEITAKLDRQHNTITGKSGNKNIQLQLQLVEKAYPYLTHP